jgi:hypothetical protein
LIATRIRRGWELSIARSVAGVVKVFESAERRIGS